MGWCFYERGQDSDEELGCSFYLSEEEHDYHGACKQCNCRVRLDSI